MFSHVFFLPSATEDDLGPGDFVKVECVACGHDALIPAPLPASASAREGGGFDQVGIR
jgi:hypothetical protein